MANKLPTSSPLSSAQSSQATFQTATSQTTPSLNPTQDLPFELLQQLKVYLEESLFTQALTFLQNLITSNASNPHKRTFVPPPEYLALFSTLIVHPSFTSRASTAERPAQSAAALRLLWTVQRDVGSNNARVLDAYRFRRYDASIPRRNGASRGVSAGSGMNDFSDSDEDVTGHASSSLNTQYADSESLFSLAEDFWAVVGWALNCSCLQGVYGTRWNYWCLWLEYMLAVLESDWEVRVETDSCGQSLLSQYVKYAMGGNARGRRILRAVLADGSAASVKEFCEVFRKELKEPKTDKNKDTTQETNVVRIAVDVDQEIYGDWMQDEDSTSEEEDIMKRDDLLQPRPSKRLRTRAPRATKRSLLTETEDSDASSAQDDNTLSKTLGPPDSIKIRLRILQLLSDFSANLVQITPAQEPVFPDLHELYTLYVEFIRPLPLTAFQKFILPSHLAHNGLKPESRIALCEFILQRLVDSDTENQRLSTFDPMSQDRLIREYLPFSAGKNTIEAQAKVGILLESLLRLLSDQAIDGNSATKNGKPILERTDDFVEAVRTGIEKRLTKSNEIRDGPRQKKVNQREEETAYRMLKESATRMTFVVEHFVRD